MQPVLRRRRMAYDALLRQDPYYDTGGQWSCSSGGTNATDPSCSPARAPLQAPEIQHCGYANNGRSRCWLAILASHGYSAGGPVDYGQKAQPGYMDRRNLAGAAAYAESSLKILADHSWQLPEWAKFKVARARTDLADVGHFLEYHEGEEQHGTMTDGYAAGGGDRAYGHPTHSKFYGQHRRRTVHQMRAEADAQFSGYGVGAPGPSSVPMVWTGPDLASVVVRPIGGTSKGLLLDLGPGGYPKPAQGMVVKIVGTYKQGEAALIQHPQYGKAIVPFQSGRKTMPSLSSPFYPNIGPGVTSASAKSARPVRRFNLMAASRRDAGMSVGAPMSQQQASAMQNVLAEHGYGVGAPMSQQQASAMQHVLAEHGYGVGACCPSCAGK
jgi:hypothetical protein